MLAGLRQELENAQVFADLAQLHPDRFDRYRGTAWRCLENVKFYLEQHPSCSPYEAVLEESLLSIEERLRRLTPHAPAAAALVEDRVAE